jgi:hypothetical protein
MAIQTRKKGGELPCSVCVTAGQKSCFHETGCENYKFWYQKDEVADDEDKDDEA